MNPRVMPHSLFHYTSANGILGVFESKSIWATRIQYLNDFSEFKHTSQLAIDAIRSQVMTNRTTKNHELNMAIGDYISRLDPYLYIACFSEEPDLLSQWRSYCPPNLGYSISFETESLASLADKQDYILRPCLYDMSQQTAIINNYISVLIDDFSTRMPDRQDPREFCQQNMNPYVAQFLDIAPFFKNPAFQEEREWRLVSKMPPDESNTKLRAGKTCLIPYRPFDLNLDANDHPINSIKIGPTPDADLASFSLLYLVRKSKKSISWSNSLIPYRNI